MRIYRFGDENGEKKEVRRGGNRAAIFIYVTEGLENMAFVSMALSLMTYFSGYMNFSLTKSATTLTNFMGTTFLLTLVGAFISETYLSRFKTCIVFACFEFLGYCLLTAQAHFRQLRPASCKEAAVGSECDAANSRQEAILYAGIYLIALGTSGVKAALPALGADQFEEGDPAEAAKLSSFFNWFLFSLTTGSIVGVTLIVWINTEVSWDWAFVVCSIALLAAIVVLCAGNSFYRNNVPKGSPILRLLQVFVASIRNRELPLPQNVDELYEIRDKEAAIPYEILQKTDQFRFFDRAAIIRNDPRVSMSDQQGPWRLCTVTQVEETKILIRMLPIIVSTIFMATCMAQLQTFSIQQSLTMDSNFLGFKIPGPSIPVIPLLFMFFLIPFYERIFVPLARKVTGIPTGIRHLQRIGIGLVLTAASMAIAGVVETRRKNVAIKHNMVDSAEPLPMSVFWLSFQFCVFGMGDMFTLVGLLEFFYAESSTGMKSLSTAIAWCSIAFGYFTSTVVVEVVNKASGGWLASNNLNRDNLNYFYWLLSVLSMLNFGFYLVCASWYRYKNVEVPQKDTCEDQNVDMATGAS